MNISFFLVKIDCLENPFPFSCCICGKICLDLCILN